MNINRNRNVAHGNKKRNRQYLKNRSHKKRNKSNPLSCNTLNLVNLGKRVKILNESKEILSIDNKYLIVILEYLCNVYGAKYQYNIA